MKNLFIDTSSSDVSIAVVEDKKVLSSITKRVPNAHSVYTVSFIERVLIESSIDVMDIDKILVVNGPGSFTGVRIGVTIAKTYAYLKNIGVIPVSALKILALSCTHDYCLTIINARNDNYYFGLYDKDNNEVIQEQFGNKEYILDLTKKYNPVIISNEDLYINDIKVEKQELDLVNITLYYQNSTLINPHLLVPNYLKLPQALEVRND